jgi:hypothetical protein
MALQDRLESGEVRLVGTYPAAPNGDEIQFRKNARAISDNLLRYGLDGSAFSAPLGTLDPNVLGCAVEGVMVLPEDLEAYCGLFATAAAIEAQRLLSGEAAA